MEAKFAAGDVVILKSGGEKMTVLKEEPEGYRCLFWQYENGGFMSYGPPASRMVTETLPGTVLKLVEVK